VIAFDQLGAGPPVVMVGAAFNDGSGMAPLSGALAAHSAFERSASHEPLVAFRRFWPIDDPDELLATVAALHQQAPPRPRGRSSEARSQQARNKQQGDAEALL
jgi:hypothetical protein